MTVWDPSCAPSFGNSVKVMMRMKMKTPTYRYELATSFNTLQQHVAQHPLQYSPLPASFNFQQADSDWYTKSGRFMNDRVTTL